MNKVISFGEALVDMLSNRIDDQSGTTNEAFTKFPGGAPANVAAAVGKLGGRSYFAGKVGQDMFGDFMRTSLQQAGVNTDYLLSTTQAKTALAFVSLDPTGERSFEFYRAPSADLFFTAEEFKDDWFGEPGIFHFCSNTLTEPGIRAATQAGVEKAKAAGCIVSFDINLRPNLWPQQRDPFEPIWHCIVQADLVKLCAEELAFVCRGRSPQTVVQQMLDGGVTLVLITDGGKPLRYHTAHGQGQLTPPPVTTVDSTAAGDAFVGGLLYTLAQQTRGASELAALSADRQRLETVLDFACRCGAHAVTHKGAFTSLPTQHDLCPSSRESHPGQR